MNWLLKLLFKAIGQFLVGFAEVLAGLINNIFQAMYELQLEIGLDKLAKYISGIAICLVAVYAVKQIYEIYVLQTEGDADNDPLEMLTSVCKSVAMIMSASTIMNYLIEMSGKLCSEVTDKIFEQEKEFTDIFTEVIEVLLSSSTVTSFAILIFLVVALVSFVIYLFKAAKRGAELMFFTIVLPLFAVDILSNSKERWNNFKTELFICIFGYVIQVAGYNIFMLLFAKYIAKGGGITGINYLIAAIAWIMFVLSAPKWLEKYLHHSGVSGVAKGGARSAMYAIPQLIRK